METANAAGTPNCRWCGFIHLTPGVCPAVKAIEFWQDGVTVKRVEFHADKPIVGCDPCLSATT